MATISFTDEALELSLSRAESRALGRPMLTMDLSRLRSFRLVKFPGKLALGYRVSKPIILNPLFGEYYNGSHTSLVVGDLISSTKVLQLCVAHPSFDQIWVCGSQVTELESKLSKFRQMSD